MSTQEMQENPRESFVWYRSFMDVCYDIYDSVPPLITAIWRYALDGIEPNFEKGVESAVWLTIKPQLDANWQRYINGLKGAPHGRKGGAPEGNTNAQKDKQPRNNPETTPNVNVNANANVNANVNANAIGFGANRFENAFALGLALVRKGYIIDTGALESEFERINKVKSPFAYAVKALDAKPAQDKAGHAAAVSFVEATGCKDCRALGVYSIKPNERGGGVFDMLCTACARDAIGAAGLQAAGEYLKSIGANKLNFVCNGCN